MKGASVRILQRGLVERRIRLHQFAQVRRFPWVPVAYRKPSTPRSRKKVSRYVGRPPPGKFAEEGSNQAWKKYRIRSSGDKFVQSQNSLLQLLLTYRDGLGLDGELPLEASQLQDLDVYKESIDRTEDLASLKASKTGLNAHRSQRLLSELHTGGTNDITIDQILATEEVFREVCDNLISMIHMACKIQRENLTYNFKQKDNLSDVQMTPEYCNLAESLLLSLVDIRSQRADLVELVYNNGRTGGGTNNNATWFGWMAARIFNPGDSNASGTNDGAATAAAAAEETKLSVHDDPVHGPNAQLVHKVIAVLHKSSFEEFKIGTVKSTKNRWSDRAKRLETLLNRMPHNITPKLNTIKKVMDCYEMSASFKSAKACQRIYERYPSMQDRLFDLLLQSLLQASRSDSKDSIRATNLAEALLRDKWENRPPKNDRQKFNECSHVLLCLYSTGRDIPDACSRADDLVTMCIGSDLFQEIVQEGNINSIHETSSLDVSTTVHLLNCLISIYSTSFDSQRIDLAKKLLLGIMADDNVRSNSSMNYPYRKTCSAVLGAVLRRDDLNSSSSKQSWDEQGENQNLQFGMEMLDMMFARKSWWPDVDFFHVLYRAVLKERPKNAGEIADELLSKMHVRAAIALDRDFFRVTIKFYHLAIRCCLVAAQMREPGAAKRAYDLLQRMEARSLALLATTDGELGGVNSSVYDKSVTPRRGSYDLVIKVCRATQIESEREAALDLALQVYQRMRDNLGLTKSTSTETYALLLSCFSELLPDNSKRRATLTRDLLEDARNYGHIDVEDLARKHGQIAVQALRDLQPAIPEVLRVSAGQEKEGTKTENGGADS